jgi:ElaB/YqjD/DUF883 family membrane-anchored ribosome-binding protein
MEKRWSLKENADEKKIDELSSQLNNLNKTLCTLLIQRGINSFEKAKSFFRPKLTALHDPFLMKDMDKAVTRLQAAIKKKVKDAQSSAKSAILQNAFEAERITSRIRARNANDHDRHPEKLNARGGRSARDVGVNTQFGRYDPY